MSSTQFVSATTPNGVRSQDTAELQEIKKGISTLFQEGQAVEIRILKTGREGTISGYFDDFEKLARATSELDEKGYPAVYWTLNPVPQALLSRTYNRYKSYVQTTTSDAEIQTRLWFLIDCDPVRPAGISSTDAEKQHAFNTLDVVTQYLTSLGFPAPVTADSGNGYHALYRIDLPNTPENKTLLENCLKALDARFTTARVKIDPAVFNAARITKAYGTKARKGDNTPDRPHRFSGIISGGAEPVIVSRELLETLASTAPAQTAPPRPNTSSGIRPEKMEEFLQWAGRYGKPPVPHKSPKGVEGFKYILDHCEFNEQHAGTEAAVFLYQDGLGYECKHDSCSDKTWGDFRQAVEARMGKKFAFVPHNGQVVDTDAIARSVSKYDPALPKTIYKTTEMGCATPQQSQVQELHLTEMGNGKRLVESYGSDIRYVVQHDSWYVWDGTRWVKDKKGKFVVEKMKAICTGMYNEATALLEVSDEVLAAIEEKGDHKMLARIKGAEALKKWAIASESKVHMSGSLFLAQSEPKVLIHSTELDTDPYLFNVRNGTIDLHTRELREHRREDMCSRVAPVTYSPFAACPKFEAWMDTIFQGDKDTIKYLQKYFGLCLSGLIEHIILILCGTGQNGKSVLIEILTSVLGMSESARGYAVNVAFSSFTQSRHGTQAGGARGDIARLEGARFVTASESNKRQLLDMATLKEFTGGDEITARRLYADDTQYKPVAKLILRTNHEPRIDDDSVGAWRRLKKIQMTYQIPSEIQQTDFAKQLFAEEADGILNWILAGWNEYISLRNSGKQGLADSQAIADSTADYRKQEIQVIRFVNEMAEISQLSGCEGSSKLFHSYTAWCERSGERAESQMAFIKALLKEFPKLEKKHTESGAVIYGIRLMGDNEDKELFSESGPQN